jgi:YrbI family 3-deoxy-D-manno-octulosonate 8-phosphate phosphatase
MIAWSIAAAQASKRVDRVVVSTEDTQIAAVAVACGAEVIDRPPHMATDNARIEPVLIHAIDTIKEKDGFEPDLLVFMQCTSPLTHPDDIDGTVELLLENDADTALAAVPCHMFLWASGDNGRATAINHDPEVRFRRQDIAPQYNETGAVYVFRALEFLKHQKRYHGKVVIYPLPPERSVDVDEINDVHIAEAYLERMKMDLAHEKLPNPVRALVMDFDGVFTDNRVFLTEDGVETVVCSRSDGAGIAMARARGLPMLVISAETNPVVASRCKKLGLPYHQGVDNKLGILVNWCQKNNIPISQTVYLGNDEGDASCLKAAGCGVVVADAYPSVGINADLRLDTPGGHGAIREIIDLILREPDNLKGGN